MNKNSHGISLNLNLANIAQTQGDINSISLGSQDEYVTKIEFIIPLAPDSITPGDYRSNYQGRDIDIRLRILEKLEDDPIIKAGKDLNFGTTVTGIPTLPFSKFTDNLGFYPCVLATLVFPYRLATWADPSHETGLRLSENYEEVQVTGPPNIIDKIIALTVLNCLLRELQTENYRAITYDAVTVFIEWYFRKPSKQPLVLRTTALASKSAYKDAVLKHFLNGFDKQHLESTIIGLTGKLALRTIETESELLKIIEETIESVLSHHIENRHWIDAFWDGERTIKYKGEKIKVPRSPKNETKIQPTLHVILDMALSPLGIQVVRESDEGTGSLDFKCLYTTSDRIGISVAIEFKLAHHKEIKKGLHNQLPAYLKAIRSRSGIFLVMWFKDNEGKYFNKPSAYIKDQMTEWLNNEARSVGINQSITISTAVIDASIKASASNL